MHSARGNKISHADDSALNGFLVHCQFCFACQIDLSHEFFLK